MILGFDIGGTKCSNKQQLKQITEILSFSETENTDPIGYFARKKMIASLIELSESMIGGRTVQKWGFLWRTA